MTKPLSPLEYKPYKPEGEHSLPSFRLEEFSNQEAEDLMDLINESIKEFKPGEKSLSLSYRRLKDLARHYSQMGNALYYIKDPDTGKPIACAGIGSFQGLPISEKIGEIRDLVVHKDYRNRGLGKKLLYRCLTQAQKIGYKRLYLETSEHMTLARKLFTNSGFTPVEELPKADTEGEGLPCYYLFPNLQDKEF